MVYLFILLFSFSIIIIIIIFISIKRRRTILSSVASRLDLGEVGDTDLGEGYSLVAVERDFGEKE